MHRAAFAFSQRSAELFFGDRAAARVDLIGDIDLRAAAAAAVGDDRAGRRWGENFRAVFAHHNGDARRNRAAGSEARKIERVDTDSPASAEERTKATTASEERAEKRSEQAAASARIFVAESEQRPFQEHFAELLGDVGENLGEFFAAENQFVQGTIGDVAELFPGILQRFGMLLHRSELILLGNQFVDHFLRAHAAI